MIIRKAERKSKGGVRVYAAVPSRSGLGVHAVVKIRSKQFSGWLCNCHDFLFNRAGRGRHCHHIKAVRKELA